MKGSCTLIGSLVAASTVALSSSGERDLTSNRCTNQGKSANSQAASLEKGKFVPKFDGLRFIETLVTAHR